ncbi:MAG: hypothetical protein HYZ16_02630 [Bacteroidetes bacterium]|jgi:hypothetical protein|nr:hypothetical protein [Bacteroidota bacterium]
MNSFLAIYSPKWRENNCHKVVNPVFSPIPRQSGEKNIVIRADYEEITEEIPE